MMFDRLIERLADEIADRLLAATPPEPMQAETYEYGNDRFTDFERSLMIKRKQQGNA